MNRPAAVARCATVPVAYAAAPAATVAAACCTCRTHLAHAHGALWQLIFTNEAALEATLHPAARSLPDAFQREQQLVAHLVARLALPPPATPLQPPLLRVNMSDDVPDALLAEVELAAADLAWTEPAVLAVRHNAAATIQSAFRHRHMQRHRPGAGGSRAAAFAFASAMLQSAAKARARQRLAPGLAHAHSGVRAVESPRRRAPGRAVPPQRPRAGAAQALLATPVVRAPATVVTGAQAWGRLPSGTSLRESVERVRVRSGHAAASGAELHAGGSAAAGSSDARGQELGEAVATVEPGAFFGELAMLSNDNKRTGTVTSSATSTCTELIMIDSTLYNRALKTYLHRLLQEKLDLLDALPALRTWPHARKVRLAYSMEARTLPFGAYLFRAGQRADHVFLLHSGHVKLLLPARRYTRASAGAGAGSGGGGGDARAVYATSTQLRRTSPSATAASHLRARAPRALPPVPGYEAAKWVEAALLAPVALVGAEAMLDAQAVHSFAAQAVSEVHLFEIPRAALERLVRSMDDAAAELAAACAHDQRRLAQRAERAAAVLQHAAGALGVAQSRSKGMLETSPRSPRRRPMPPDRPPAPQRRGRKRGHRLLVQPSASRQLLHGGVTTLELRQDGVVPLTLSPRAFAPVVASLSCLWDCPPSGDAASSAALPPASPVLLSDCARRRLLAEQLPAPPSASEGAPGDLLPTPSPAHVTSVPEGGLEPAPRRATRSTRPTLHNDPLDTGVHAMRSVLQLPRSPAARGDEGALQPGSSAVATPAARASRVTLPALLSPRAPLASATHIGASSVALSARGPVSADLQTLQQENQRLLAKYSTRVQLTRHWAHMPVPLPAGISPRHVLHASTRFGYGGLRASAAAALVSAPHAPRSLAALPVPQVSMMVLPDPRPAVE